MVDPSKSPSEVISAFLAAMAVGDYDSAMNYIASDCEYDNVPMGKVYGPEGVRATLEPFFAPTLENELIVLRQVIDGPVVVMERLDRHRLLDGWVELPVMGVWEVRGGQITLWRDYFDLATLMNAWPAAVAGTPS
jgi:limonene-1,2-epoxide hydrolase